MTISEDELADALIRYHRESQEETRTYPEAHYNHYGNSGVADLYVAEGDWKGEVYELKSETAVGEVTGTNEILQQFNKIREFFFPGSSHTPPTKSLQFELCFTPSEYNFRHLAENAETYRSAVKQDLTDVATERVLTTVTVRPADPENIEPIIFFAPNFDLFEMDPVGYMEGVQPEILAEHRDVIEEIA